MATGFNGDLQRSQVPVAVGGLGIEKPVARPPLTVTSPNLQINDQPTQITTRTRSTPLLCQCSPTRPPRKTPAAKMATARKVPQRTLLPPPIDRHPPPIQSPPLPQKPHPRPPTHPRQRHRHTRRV
jgi:hypothetical protein